MSKAVVVEPVIGTVINPDLCNQSSIKITVDQQSEIQIPYVHVYLDAKIDSDNCAYVRLDAPAYLEHHKDGKYLNKKQKKEFIKIMKKVWKDYVTQSIYSGEAKLATGYEAAVEIWKKTHDATVSFSYDRNGFLKMPDYKSFLQIGENIMINTTEISSSKTKKEISGVTLLGSGNTVYPTTYTPEILETFDNKHQDNDYIVSLDAYEVSALCPVTHQPDFAKLVIQYIPNVKMVESKSLKLYLFSFRNYGTFHEDLVNTVMKDLVNLMDPKYLEVTGIFATRGGIAIKPCAIYVNPKYPEYNDLKQARFLQNLSDQACRKVKYDE